MQHVALTTQTTTLQRLRWGVKKQKFNNDDDDDDDDEDDARQPFRALVIWLCQSHCF